MGESDYAGVQLVYLENTAAPLRGFFKLRIKLMTAVLPHLAQVLSQPTERKIIPNP
jgi:hypothetical protein